MIYGYARVSTDGEPPYFISEKPHETCTPLAPDVWTFLLITMDFPMRGVRVAYSSAEGCGLTNGLPPTSAGVRPNPRGYHDHRG